MTAKGSIWDPTPDTANTGPPGQLPLAPPPGNPLSPGHWANNWILRVILGLLFAMGTAYSLKRGLEAFVAMFFQIDAHQIWTEPPGFALLQVLHGIALLFAGTLAGAGIAGGLAIGVTIGMLHGFTTIFGKIPESIPPILFFAQPLWHMVFGLLGTLLGGWIWRPPVLQPLNTFQKVGAKPQTNPFDAVLQFLAGMVKAKINWLRVFLGGSFTVAGIVFSREIVDLFLKTTRIEDMLVNTGPADIGKLMLIVQGLSIFLGAFIASAATEHGTAHGGWVGIIGGVAYMLFRLATQKANESLDSNKLIFETACILGLSLVSGAFGAGLLPPVIRVPQRKGKRVEV